MRKPLIIGVVAAVMIAVGATIIWVGAPNGQLVVTTPPVLAQAADVNQTITDSGQAAIKSAIAAVGPAVVRINVTGTVTVTNPFSDLLDNEDLFRRFFGDPFRSEPQEQEMQSVGSGVIFLHQGEKLVLTNAHVVDGATEILLTDVDGYQWPAEIIGVDELLDIAVLRVQGDTTSLATAVLGDSDTVEIGDWAIAIGNPIGLSYTVTLGIISAEDRDSIDKPGGVGTYNNLIQTDAAINPGNSGGPLVNAYGEVIGINTLIARGSSSGVTIEGINFAIAINGIRDVLDQLVVSGEVERGWLGVSVGDIVPSIAQRLGISPDQPGALIGGFFPGDPADLAGIEVDDIVIRIGDATIAEADDLIREVALLGAGVTVEFEVLRDRETRVLEVTLGVRPSEEELLSYEGQGSLDTAEAASEFGITVSPLTPIMVEHLGLNSSFGVVIMDIVSGSPADRAGLSEGDVILEIDHQPIQSVDEWNAAVAEVGDHATLTVLSNGRIGFVEL